MICYHVLLDTGIGNIVDLKGKTQPQTSIQDVVDKYLEQFDDPRHFNVVDSTWKGVYMSTDNFLERRMRQIRVRLQADQIFMKYNVINKDDLSYDGPVKCGQTDSVRFTLERLLKGRGVQFDNLRIVKYNEVLPSIAQAADIDSAIWDGGHYELEVALQYEVTFELSQAGTIEKCTIIVDVGANLHKEALKFLESKNIGLKIDLHMCLVTVDDAGNRCLTPVRDDKVLEKSGQCYQIFTAIPFPTTSGSSSIVELAEMLQKVIENSQERYESRLDTKLNGFMEKITEKLNELDDEDEDEDEEESDEEDEVGESLNDIKADLNAVKNMVTQLLRSKETYNYNCAWGIGRHPLWQPEFFAKEEPSVQLSMTNTSQQSHVGSSPYQQKIEELEKKLAEKEKQIKTLENDLDSATKNVEILIEANGTDMDKVMIEQRKLKSTIQGLEAMNACYSAEIQKKEDDMALLKADIELAKFQYTDKSRFADKLHRKLQEESSRWQNTEVCLKNAQIAVEKHLNEILRLTAELEEEKARRKVQEEVQKKENYEEGEKVEKGEEQKEEKEKNKENEEREEKKEENNKEKDDESSGAEDFDVIDENFMDYDCKSTYSSADEY